MEASGVDLAVFFNSLVTICLGVSAIGGVVALIIKATTPFKKLRAVDMEHEKRLAAHDELFKRDLEAIKELHRSDNVLLRGMLAVLKAFEKMDSGDTAQIAREEIEKYLVERSS